LIAVGLLYGGSSFVKRRTSRTARRQNAPLNVPPTISKFCPVM
jgi:hypothetical protein